MRSEQSRAVPEEAGVHNKRTIDSLLSVVLALRVVKAHHIKVKDFHTSHSYSRIVQSVKRNMKHFSLAIRQAHQLLRLYISSTHQPKLLNLDDTDTTQTKT